MQVKVESTGTLERKLRVELPLERVEREVASRLKSVGKTARVKGFRPGKVPERVVRQKYGKQIREEVVAELLQRSYSDAVIQEKLQPAGAPRIERQADDGKHFAYVATLEVLPEVELRGLDKIKIEVPEVEIGDGDVDAMIEKLREQKATWTAVERASRDGDRVVCDFRGTMKGEPIKGGTGTNVPVVLGQGQMLPDFEKGLAGLAAGETKSFKVKFPKDYHADDLKGSKVDFEVTVHKVEEKSLPPVDDAFAESFNVTQGGIEQFRKDVRDNMEREARSKVRSDLRQQVMQGLLDANPIEIPRTLKHQEMHAIQHEAMRRLGIDDHDRAPPEENFAEAAEKRVRLGLLLRQLIGDQRLTLDEARLRTHVEELCAGYEAADEMVEMYMKNPDVRRQVEPAALEQVAIDWLVDHGTSTNRKVRFADYMNS
jgi:trigger factor